MDEPRWWYLVPVAFLFAPLSFPPILALWALPGSLTEPGSAAGLRLLLVLFLPSVLALAVVLVSVPVGVALDARAVQRLGWETNARRWLLASVVYPVSLFTAALYLYRRKQAVGLAGIGREEPLSREEIARSRWWVLAPLGAIGGLFALVSLFVLPSVLDGSPTVLLAAYAMLVSMAIYGLGIWVDRAQLRSSELDWSPSHLWIAAAGVGLLGVVIAGTVYPVVRRRSLRRASAPGDGRDAPEGSEACAACDGPIRESAFCTECGRHPKATTIGLLGSYAVGLLVVLVGVEHVVSPRVPSDVLVGVVWTLLGTLVLPAVQRRLRRRGVELGRWTALGSLLVGVVAVEWLVVSLDGPP